MRYQHCVLLPISLILLVSGIVTLLLFGIGNLEPYTHTKNFKTATCIVVQSNVSGSVPCRHQDTDDPHKIIHQSTYPCLTIIVNYTEHLTQYDVFDYQDDDDDEEETDGIDLVDSATSSDTNVTTNNSVIHVHNKAVLAKPDQLTSVDNVMIYDSYDSWTQQRQGAANSTCTVHKCQADAIDNQDDVHDFMEDYGTVGYIFRCYFNPRNKNEVFADVVSGNSVMHALVWPALAIGFGVFLLVVVAFLSCEVWICRNPKREQRRMQGQTYELASYRESGERDVSRHGWREHSNRGDPGARDVRPKRREGDGNNNSRLPNFSAAADIIRKWSYRGRSDRHSSSSNKESSDTNRSSRSYGGNPSRQWSIGKGDKSYPTT